MNIEQQLKAATITAIHEIFQLTIAPTKVIVNDTKKNFEGDFTIVVFPFVKLVRQKPEEVGKAIGRYLQEHLEWVTDFNVVKGFLNLVIADYYWVEVIQYILENEAYGSQAPTAKKIVVEYGGPNTNKPLHLGHIRNLLLGYGLANILQANGHQVHKVNIYNDRGIAICKSMLAWQKFGQGKTPETSGKKGDHLVGEYYVKFARVYKEQIAQLVAEGATEEIAKKQAPILLEAQKMLRQWEADDVEVHRIWQMMNGWTLKGIKATFVALGVDFEKDYFESEAYLRGKEIAQEGLVDGQTYQKEDGGIWIDLTDQKLDHKVLIRRDGTSVYITQDLAVAESRYKDYQMEQSIYVVGEEQRYHFQVLAATLKKLEKPYSDGIYHYSYGMMELPHGKMKSREGTVVDADDLIAEMLETAEKYTKELGKTDGLTEAEAQKLYQTLGLGALKYFILKVDPKKKMIFNPQASIDFLGDTGPFIQYSHARIQSILRKYGQPIPTHLTRGTLTAVEKDLIVHLYKYDEAIREAGKQYAPSVIAAYAYSTAKLFNKFYAEVTILNNEEETTNLFRVALSALTARMIKKAMGLLGITVPDRM